MTLLNYGQPDDGIIQMAYVVEDIDSAMSQWTASLRAGPWFLLPHFTGEDPTYRGSPSRADVAIAMGFSGHMLIELIAPNDDEPSVYREVIDRSGYGFHHFGVGTRDLEGIRHDDVVRNDRATALPRRDGPSAHRRRRRGRP